MITRYRVSKRSRCLQSPCNVACLRHCEIVYHHENHFSLSYENKMAFFYLSACLLALVVSASSVKTSKGIIFFSRCSDTRVPLCFISWYLHHVLKKIWAKTILIGHLHFFIKHRTYAKRWDCKFSCSQRLLFEHHNCWYRTGPRLLWVRVQVSGEGSVFVLQPGRFGW